MFANDSFSLEYGEYPIYLEDSSVVFIEMKGRKRFHLHGSLLFYGHYSAKIELIDLKGIARNFQEEQEKCLFCSFLIFHVFSLRDSLSCWIWTLSQVVLPNLLRLKGTRRNAFFFFPRLLKWLLLPAACLPDRWNLRQMNFKNLMPPPLMSSEKRFLW